MHVLVLLITPSNDSQQRIMWKTTSLCLFPELPPTFVQQQTFCFLLHDKECADTYNLNS